MFRTRANPSKAPPLETRNTGTVSTLSVSTRMPEPKTRSMDLATLVGGADCAESDDAKTARTAKTILELIAHPQAQLLAPTETCFIAIEPVVTLEHHVVHRLVGEPQGSDPPCQGLIFGLTLRHGSLCI